MQEHKDVRADNIQKPKSSPPPKIKLSKEEEKLVDLLAQIIVDRTLRDCHAILPDSQNHLEEVSNTRDPFTT